MMKAGIGRLRLFRQRVDDLARLLSPGCRFVSR